MRDFGARPAAKTFYCPIVAAEGVFALHAAKSALLFAEHVDEEVLGDLPVRQYVVTIPKMLRLSFKYDRKLLGVAPELIEALDLNAGHGLIATIPNV